MHADLGDLSPDYARWLLHTQPIESLRELYDLRERHLPEDVQAALRKAGAKF